MMQYSRKRTADHWHPGIGGGRASEPLFFGSPAYQITEADLGKLQGWPGITNPVLSGKIQKDACISDATGVIYTKRGDVGSEDPVAWAHDFRHPTGGTARPSGYNLFLGEQAGNFTMGATATATYQASLNLGLGYKALNALTTGFDNFAGGFNAGAKLTTGWGHFIAGYDAGSSMTTANSNWIGGYEAGKDLTTGSQNFMGGRSAGRGITTGSDDICLGLNSGRYLADGSTANTAPSGCIYFGNETRSKQASQSNEVVIGNGVTGNGSNTVTIGGSSITDTYLAGALNLTAAMKLAITTATGRAGSVDFIPIVVNGTTRYLRIFD